MLTAFLICNATDLTRFLLAKEKLLVACEDTGKGDFTSGNTGSGDNVSTNQGNEKSNSNRSLLKSEKLLVACEDTGNGEDVSDSKDTNNNNTDNSAGNCGDTGTCDNEKTEFEKINDDQLLTSHSVYFDKGNLSIPLKSSFFYTVSFLNEIYRNIFSPPPELV